jgi:hypothetical protein
MARDLPSLSSVSSVVKKIFTATCQMQSAENLPDLLDFPKTPC